MNRLGHHGERSVKEFAVDTDGILNKGVASSTEEEWMRADVYRRSRQFEATFVGAFLTPGQNVSVKCDHMV